MAAQMSNIGRISRLFASKCRIRLSLASRKSGERWIQVYPCSVLTSSFHSTTRFGASIPIKMPKLSPTMEEGTIIKWYKKEGDTITPGDVLCDVETDKATVALDLEEDGILAKILFPENTKEIKIGKLIAVMVEEGDDWQNASIPDDAGDAVDHSDAERTTPATSVGAEAKQSHSGINDDGHLIGPAVKNLLEMYPIRIDDVAGSGRHGAVLKGDVLQTIKEKSLQPQTQQVEPTTAPPAPVTPPKPARKAPPVRTRKGAPYADLELTGMRRTIAKRLTESKTTIPHAYSTIDCTVDNVMKLRKKLKADDVKLSVNDFVIKAAAMALRQVPGVNASLSGETVTSLPTVDISVAVATKNGLITPIVRDADLLGLVQISSTVKELSQRARDGKLKPEEFIGGSFSISNLGMFGITEFTAVINPPQACILAVGTSQIRLDAEKPRTVMRVTISSDSRIVDDSLAARFLSAFKQNLETPELMPIGSGGETSDFLDLDAL